jgi:hypothetical protein
LWAVGVYATYRAYNAARHAGSFTEEAARDAFRQAALDVVAGTPCLAALLRECRGRLPVWPLRRAAEAGPAAALAAAAEPADEAPAEETKETPSGELPAEENLARRRRLSIGEALTMF